MKETLTAVYFFSGNDPFSNFYKSDFNQDGNTFNCVEQYFTYRKCMHFDSENTELIADILSETDPKIIKIFGRQVKNYNDATWNSERFTIMKEGLLLKFSQNEGLKQLLLNTNDKTLYEASKYDILWGIGYDINTAINTDTKLYGQNLLGEALMEIRNHLS